MVLKFSLRPMPKAIYIRFGIIIIQENFSFWAHKGIPPIDSRILRNTWGIITENLPEGEKKKDYRVSYTGIKVHTQLILKN